MFREAAPPRSDFPPFLKRKSAFTLLELMISIGIVAALVMLGFGLVRRATEGNRSMQCLSQLRQIYAALIHYTVDNRGMLPPATDPGRDDYPWNVDWKGPWVSPRTLPERGFPGYFPGGVAEARRLVMCPENLRVTPNYLEMDPFRHYYLCNYDLMTSSGYSTPPARLSEIQTHNTVLLLDSATGTSWGSVGIPSRVFQTEAWKRVGEPHGNRLNVLWADGHVTPVAKAELTLDDFVRKPR